MRVLRLLAAAGFELSADDRTRVESCYRTLADTAPDDYRQLAALLAFQWRDRASRSIGIGAGQGAGKSTLCRLLQAAASFYGDRVAVLGIDDFYLTKDQRVELAARVHPLLATRGPPGTHDIDALIGALTSLLEGRSVEVPVFDKGIDDRSGTRAVSGPVDRVIVEGWCVGARVMPEADLHEPINELERREDPQATWRQFMNAALAGSYGRLNDAFDELVFLEVPDIDAVRRWRLQQETERPPAQRMDAQEVVKFVAHYERITRWMLDDLSNRADMVVELAADHGVAGIRCS